MDRYIEATNFYNKYVKLKERDKDHFSRVANKLLAVNFLTNKKESDQEDYYFISQHFELFKSYFALMDYELAFYNNDRVIMLFNTANYNRLNLKLIESIVILILRILYDAQMREVSLTDRITIKLGEIHDMFNMTGFQDRKLNKSDMKRILSTFRKFNLLDFIDNDFGDDDSRIILYPTLLHAVSVEQINDLYKKLATYRKEEEDEETNED